MNIIDTNNWHIILDKMIVIGGSARSGTTIVGKLINSLKDVEYQFEPPMLESILLKENELSEKSLKELLQSYFFDNFLLDCLSGRNINLNKNDDSCILNVKSEKEIQKRYEKSFTRNELEEIVKKTTFSFKLPEIVFFLDLINSQFDKNRTILMHRNPNDVINSIIKKEWFSDEFLNEKHPSQIKAVKIIESIKIPYWVKHEDEVFWVNATELDRCAYYYKRVSTEILTHYKKSIIIDYDIFVQEPEKIINIISDSLNLEMTEKTYEIINSVNYQDKKRDNLLLSVSNDLREDILLLDTKLKKLSLKDK